MTTARAAADRVSLAPSYSGLVNLIFEDSAMWLIAQN